MDRFLKLLPQAVSNLPNPVRYRAENALTGFQRAKTLLPIDREIASFRAITAAEEAASALIRSLQLRDYPGADRIDLKRHDHKAAVGFFLDAIRVEVTQGGTLDVTVTLAVNPPKLTVSLPIRQFVQLDDDLQNLHVQFVDPLGWVGTKEGVEQEHYFDAAVQKVAQSRKVDKLLASLANSRNRILYAHDGGLPKSEVTQHAIEQRKRLGIVCIVLSIAVLQVEHHQGAALQCLAGYLKIISRANPSS